MADVPLDSDYGSDISNWNDNATTSNTTDNEAHYKPMTRSLRLTVIVLFYPAVIILNIILFLIIVTRRQLRGDPWRVLIAHTSACIILLAAFLCFFTFLEMKHLEPIVHLCPGLVIFEEVFSKMLRFCFVLVCIERFRSLLRDRDHGLERKTIIIVLLVFWAVIIIEEITAWLVGYWDEKLPAVDDELKYVLRGCTPTSIVTGTVNLITKILAVVCVLVVVTGGLVLVIKYKQTTDRVRASAVPLLVIGFVYLCHLFVALSFTHKHSAALIICRLAWIAFPLTWLVVWGITGDICSKRQEPPPPCDAKDVEQEQMLQTNDTSNIKQ